MNKRIRITQDKLENAVEYMKNWIDSENWSDLNVCLNHQGDDLYAAELLVSSGAIDSKTQKQYGELGNYENELVIETLAKQFRKMSRKKQSKHIENTFKTCFIASCEDCNHVSFVDDGNEDLYPELKTECWECKSKNIKTRRGL